MDKNIIAPILLAALAFSIYKMIKSWIDYRRLCRLIENV